jgi:hypothetical protein
MNSKLDFLLFELSKAPDQIQRNEVLEVLSTLDGSNLEDAPLIFFLLDSLFRIANQPGSSLSLKDVLLKVFGNPSLLPIVYQVPLEEQQGRPDVELDQMIALIKSFQSVN